MPPRIRAPSASLATDAALQRRPRTALLTVPLTAHLTAPLAARTFSTTLCLERMTSKRFKMYQWINSRMGREFAQVGQGPRYIGPAPDQPFPLNPLFRSQPVLDEQTRELIWRKVMERGDSLKAVSAEMSVDVRRVAAVVRLKEVERKWQREGKQLAAPYARSVMRMLPKTSFHEGEPNEPHEAINEVHVHGLTTQQLFVPVSESRHFNREDAAKAFHDTLLPIDERSPQRHLIAMERDLLEGKSREESMARFREATQKEEDAVARRLLRQKQKEEEQTTRFRTNRCEFRFTEINVQDAGPKGRSRKASGWRYGAPFDDRKRGAVKIPTSMP